jgi:hypothetical protein
VLVVVTEEMEWRTTQRLGGGSYLRAAHDLEEDASDCRTIGWQLCGKSARLKEGHEIVQRSAGAFRDFANVRHYYQAEKTRRKGK